MSGTWNDGVQRYLDGDGAPPADGEARARADRFRAAVEAYSSSVRAPGAEVDRAVMAVVRRRAGGRAGRRTVWRWFVASRLEMRPVLALAAALALVVASAVLTTVFGPSASRPAGPPVGGSSVAAGTVLVRFELDAPAARQVALAGSFNEWSDSTIVFARSPETGRWTVTVALEPGEHQYLFVVDGERWIPDPAAHAQVQDEFGQTNSLLVVGPRGVVRS